MKSALASATFWWETLDRALKTGAQDIIKVLAAAEIANLAGVNWLDALSFAAFGILLSVLTSIASAPFGKDESPTLLHPEVLNVPA